MKNFIIILMASFLLGGCINRRTTADQAKSEIKPTKNDDGEWDLDVMDSQWDYFLTAVARPPSMYSEAFLKSKNSFLVSEWNSYYYAGRYRNIIESSIDYNPSENYGKNFEYKLYQVFAYVNWKYRLRLNGLSGVDAVR